MANIHKASQGDLILYNGQAVIDRVFDFTIENDAGDVVDFVFSGYISSFFRVYDERDGRELLDLSMSQTTNNLIMNLSQADATFEDLGKYFYEIGYLKSGGYEEVIKYGTLTII